MPPQNVQSQEAGAEWQAQYEFFTRIISDQVARLRWNEGFEPVACHLYPLKDAHGRTYKFLGSTRICGRDFECSALAHHNPEGNPTLKLLIRVSRRRQHH